MTMLRSLYHAYRSLLHKPGFSIAVALTLALGMGANCAVLLIANAVLFRPLPYADSDRVVQLWTFTPEQPELIGTVSFPDFVDWQTRNKSFSGMTAYNISTADLLTPSDSEQIAGASVTVDFFQVLGVRPALGRTFSVEDRNAPVVVLAHSLWRREFGGRASVVGETAKLSGRLYTVIGVMPASFLHPEPLWNRTAEFWRPIQGFENRGRGFRYLRVLGRLKAGVDLDLASAEMSVIGTQLAAEFPTTDAGKGVHLIPLRKQMFGGLYRPLFLLFGVSFAVLLVACANITNLQFVRANSRVRDVLIRIAVGAKPRDLIFWLLGESLLLALLGGAVGLSLGYIVVLALRRVAPATIRGLDLAVVDGRAIAFTSIVVLFTALLTAIPPLVRVFKVITSTNPVLANLDLGTNPSKQRVQSFVIAAQLTAVLPLLIATLVLSRSFFNLVNVNPGFGTSNVLTLRVDLPRERYPDSEHVRAFFEEASDRTMSIPGVRSVALASSVPLTALNTEFVVPAAVQRGESPNSARTVYYRVVSAKFFETLSIPLIAGETFSASDRESKRGVAIVNRRFAEEYLPHQNPIGREVFVFLDTAPTTFTVIGMVQDIRSVSLAKAPEPEIYVPFGQDPPLDMALVVRTNTPPADLERSVRSTLAQIDKEVAAHDVQTMEEIIRSCTSNARFATLLVTILSVLAFCLSLIGVAGVVAYAVSDHTKDLAIRLALGATHVDIMINVMTRILGVSACGILLGLLLATYVDRIPADLMFGIKPIDLLSFCASTLILSIGTVVVSYVSASRILRIDPASSLRTE